VAIGLAPRVDGWWARRQRAYGFTPALGASDSDPMEGERNTEKPITR
jgi:hypothetical protein